MLNTGPQEQERLRQMKALICKNRRNEGRQAMLKHNAQTSQAERGKHSAGRQKVRNEKHLAVLKLPSITGLLGPCRSWRRTLLKKAGVPLKKVGLHARIAGQRKMNTVQTRPYNTMQKSCKCKFQAM